LSTLEGYIMQEVDETEMEAKQRGGKVSVKVAEGSGASEKSTETRRRLAVTDAAQFQRLYELLEDANAIQYLEAFDLEIWQQLKRNEMLEIQANLRVPEILMQLQQANNLMPYIDLMRIIGEDPLSDPKTAEAMSGMRSLHGIFADKSIPLLFEAVSAPGFHFFASLSRQYLKCDLSELRKEAVVFGKVQRILPKGESQQVFSILPELESLAANRKQRRAMKADQPEGATEVLKGPAIILTPLSVYR
jgi:hypothetical protein